MKYRDFLRELSLIQLRKGRNGIRLVGTVQRDKVTNELRLGLIVPDAGWKDAADS